MERTAQFNDFIDEAQAYLRAKQSEMDSQYRLLHWPRYDWDQETRQLLFSEDGVTKLITEIQFVGSISTKSNTWLWAWANDSVDPQLCSSMSVVRKFGEEHGFDHLISKKWHAHEVDGWEMTSIAAFLVRARGAYRTPDEDGFTYMIMTDVHWPT